MYKYEQRDKSGPMDVDNPDPMARLAQYAIPAHEDGPSRKRLHMDIDTPSRPFNSSASSSTSANTLHFGTNTPFIFHSAPRPTSPAYEPYDPSKWASKNFKFGFGGGGQGAEDVEMRFGDSPRGKAEPSVNHHNSANIADEDGDEPLANKAPTKSKSEKKQFEVGQPEGEAEERRIASGAMTRVRRKRQKEKEWRKRRGSDSEPDEIIQGKSEHHYNLHMPTQALSHSEIPSLLLGYLQFFVNASIVLFCIFLAVQFVLTVKRDVQDRMREHSVELLQEIAECTNLYLTNRCDPSLRVPAMEAACRAWELCMNRDPTVIGRIDVVAETFAGVINSFVDPISWKTMAFTLVTLSFLTILTNSALFNLRSRHTPQPAPPPQYQQPPPGQHYLPGQAYQHYPNQAQHGMQQWQQPYPQGPGQGQIGAAPGGWEDEKAKKKGWW